MIPELINYQDEGGLLSHVKYNREGSENKTLHLVDYFLVKSYLEEVIDFLLVSEISKPLTNCYDMSEDKWYATTDHKQFLSEGFSRDNMIAVTSFFAFIRSKLFPETAITVVNFYASAGNKHWWNYQYWQPQDIAYFAYTARKWYGYLLLPITLINMYLSGTGKSYTKSGALHSTPRILVFIRLMTLASSKSKFLNWFCNLCHKKITNLIFDHYTSRPELLPSGIDLECPVKYRTQKAWQVMFGCYFEYGHPINKLFIDFFSNKNLSD